MSLLTGELAFLWASIISVPVALAIQVALNWFWRWSPIQRIVMPGADECRGAENLLHVLMDGTRDLKPFELAAMGQMLHGLLLRNGMNAIANALIFAVVFTGSHALLMAL